VKFAEGTETERMIEENPLFKPNISHTDIVAPISAIQ
jgi:hypothetical protein